MIRSETEYPMNYIASWTLLHHGPCNPVDRNTPWTTLHHELCYIVTDNTSWTIFPREPYCSINNITPWTICYPDKHVAPWTMIRSESFHSINQLHCPVSHIAVWCPEEHWTHYLITQIVPGTMSLRKLWYAVKYPLRGPYYTMNHIDCNFTKHGQWKMSFKNLLQIEKSW